MYQECINICTNLNSFKSSQVEILKSYLDNEEEFLQEEKNKEDYKNNLINKVISFYIDNNDVSIEDKKILMGEYKGSDKIVIV